MNESKVKDKLILDREQIVACVINKIKKENGYVNCEFSVNLEVLPDDIIMKITVES